MSISVLSQRSGVSAVMVKYYIHEGLTRSTLGPKADDVEIANQFRLIRGLVHVVGLSIRQVRKILNLVRDPELSPAALMTSVTADLSLAGARVVDDIDLTGVRAALASVGFDGPPDVLYVNQSLVAITLAKENGVGMGAEHLVTYTIAARECVKGDFDHMLSDFLSRRVQTAMLGILIYDLILIGLWCLARHELVNQLTSFQSQWENEKEAFGTQNMIPEANTAPIAWYLCFGLPEVPCIVETSASVAGPHDLVVNVMATSANRIDTNAQAGRDKFLIGRRLPQPTGSGFSGEVVGVGPQVHGFDIRQRVWGFLGTDQPGKRGTTTGGIAADTNLVASAPVLLDLVELAALPLVGIMAWQTPEKLGVGSDSRLLIVGGVGGVGSMVVQVVRAHGAFVDIISSVRHNELLRQLGAKSCFDPESAVWSALTDHYQAVFGTTGNNLWQLRRLVTSSGRLFTIPPAGIPVSFLIKILPGLTIVFMSVQPSHIDLVILADPAETGQLNPII